MVRQISFYDFFGCFLRSEHPPLLEMNWYSTAEGYIEITTPGILSGYTLDAEVYKLIAPTSIEPRYIKTGGDLYAPEVLYISQELMSNGNLRIFFRFDAYSIMGVTHDDYFGITFYVNKLRDAQYVKVATDIIVHIVNVIKEA